MAFKRIALIVYGASTLSSGFVPAAYALSANAFEKNAEVLRTQKSCQPEEAFKTAVEGEKALDGVDSISRNALEAVDEARAAIGDRGKVDRMMTDLRFYEAARLRRLSLLNDSIEELGRLFLDSRLAKVPTQKIYDSYLAYRVKDLARSGGLLFSIYADGISWVDAKPVIERLRQVGIQAEYAGDGRFTALATSDRDVDILMKEFSDPASGANFDRAERYIGTPLRGRGTQIGSGGSTASFKR